MTPTSDNGCTSDTAAVDGFRIAVSNEQQALDIDEEWLRDVTRSVLLQEGVSAGQISIALVDDPTIHDVNRRFLQHDYPTDVISFLLDARGKEPGPTAATASHGTCEIDAEVVISGETAARTAIELGCPAAHELALYLVHGLLHLCGYDDQTDADRAMMRSRESSHLQKFGITAHYES